MTTLTQPSNPNQSLPPKLTQSPQYILFNDLFKKYTTPELAAHAREVRERYHAVFAEMAGVALSQRRSGVDVGRLYRGLGSEGVLYGGGGRVLGRPSVRWCSKVVKIWMGYWGERVGCLSYLIAILQTHSLDLNTHLNALASSSLPSTENSEQNPTQKTIQGTIPNIPKLQFQIRFQTQSSSQSSSQPQIQPQNMSNLIDFHQEKEDIDAFVAVLKEWREELLQEGVRRAEELWEVLGRCERWNGGDGGVGDVLVEVVRGVGGEGDVVWGGR